MKCKLNICKIFLTCNISKQGSNVCESIPMFVPAVICKCITNRLLGITEECFRYDSDIKITCKLLFKKLQMYLFTIEFILT